MPPLPSSTAPSSSRHLRSPESIAKFAGRAIFPALQGKSCPICLENLTERRSAAVITVCKHGYCLACIRKWSSFKRNCPLCNTRFDSWFIVSDFASRKYHKEQLPILRDRETLTYHRNNPSDRRRSRDVLENSSSRSRPLPWRRSFGRPGSVPDSVIFQRKLQWRASIYTKQLRAVRLHSRRLELSLAVNDYTKAKITERIEPWIRRELQAVLGDPDPSVIVHFASALFIKRLERENNRQTGQTGMLVEDEVSSLRKFLSDKVDIFWHELR
uniref:RING-type E3 ubiquitin transferase n=1 Tax=Arabidopsis thaliana TaxID=3702 RepID=Q9ZUZ8_ARATH|nr:putative RING zinc finger protein [Arabidopsis thaliana]